MNPWGSHVHVYDSFATFASHKMCNFSINCFQIIRQIGKHLESTRINRNIARGMWNWAIRLDFKFATNKAYTVFVLIQMWNMRQIYADISANTMRCTLYKTDLNSLCVFFRLSLSLLPSKRIGMPRANYVVAIIF